MDGKTDSQNWLQMLKHLGKMLDRFIWMVGLITVISYLLEHAPSLLSVLSRCVIVGFGAWYFWKYCAVPFREGLKAD